MAVIADDRPVIKLVRLFAVLVLGGTGLFGFSLLSSHGPTTPSVDCQSVTSSVTGLLDKSKVPNVGGWEDTTTIQRNGRTSAHLIVNNAQCFDPSLVATAQTLLDH